jgi:BirA family transcriptional regulator, biotin operon repressor / biotin---[acetyl-CoA-carboxylase] ligase
VTAYAGGSLDPRRWRTLSNLVVLASTSSSNDLASELVEIAFAEEQEMPSTALVSESQTAARGRKGSWAAPAGKGIYATILRKSADGEPLSLVPLAVGRWVREVLSERAGLQASLKWPNDVYAGGRKLAGILAESRTQGEDTYVAVGIGLNVLGSGASLGVGTATTVEEQTGLAVELAPLLQAILDRIDAELSAPGWEREVELWQRASVHHPGDRLTIRNAGSDGELTGEYRGLTPEGFLRLGTAGGQERVLSTGELASW